MKKIVAIWLSINLLVLNVLPSVAQIPQAAKGVRNLKITDSARLLSKWDASGVLPSGVSLLTPAVQNAVLTHASLSLPLQHAQLVPAQSSPAALAHAMLLHPNVQERNLLLRTDFVSLSLKNQVLAGDRIQAADFYRKSLQENTTDSLLTLNDIVSLGVLGSAQKDAKAILQAAQKSAATAQEAAVTAVAARALLRLGAYDELAQLAQQSTVQPQLWDGIAAYAAVHRLPLTLAKAERKAVPVEDIQQQVQTWGPLNYVAVDPSLHATALYMNAGKTSPASQLRQAAQKSLSAVAPEGEKFVVAPTQTAALAAAAEQAARDNWIAQMQEKLQSIRAAADKLTPSSQEVASVRRWLYEAETTAADTPALVSADPAATATYTKSSLLAQIKGWIERLKPSGLSAADETKFSQRAALYLTAFSIGLEIGTPIMASIKGALNLPLSYAILVTVATFSPYLFGSFMANWLKGKIGRKGTINAGLALMGGSFAVGAAALGLDGSFTAWENGLAQYFSILGALTVASTGSVFIHNATGPVMTEISKKANELIRQKRGTYIELARSVGMMSSFAFPFIATSMLGMDWSAPFLLALPVVAASALGLNLAKLPNSKPEVLPAPKLAQSPVMDGTRKPRKAKMWKDSLLNNGYVRLLREEPGVGSFIGGLFAMNAVEVAFNSGFLFMLPRLTTDESSQYLYGMLQYAVAFLAGRYLAGHFLKWFPKHNISAATLLAALGGTAALGFTHNVDILTAALGLAEVGVSTAFTLAFARTAKNHLTQDRVTSLIMASAVSCAVGPFMLTQAAQLLIDSGVMSEADATIASLIAIPSALAFLSVKLFRNMEGAKSFRELIQKIKDGWTQGVAKLKAAWQK